MSFTHPYGTEQYHPDEPMLFDNLSTRVPGGFLWRVWVYRKGRAPSPIKVRAWTRRGALRLVERNEWIVCDIERFPR